MTEKIDIKSLSIEEIKLMLRSIGEPSYRAGQIFKWLHLGVSSFEEMTNLSKKLRAVLDAKCVLTVPEIIKKQVSALDKTTKYLWRLSDGNSIESVLMYYEHGVSLCVSTQAGCKMGCAFCASTKNGFVRNLKPSEILDQIIFAQKDSGERISSIVLMGIGEPLDNMENVLKFLHLVHAPEGIHLSHRHISLSTCGLVPQIEKLKESKLQITLSISLHAPTNELRDEIMPVNRIYPLEQLLKACKSYFDMTGRRISYEYAMIRGFNDTDYCADKLTALFRGTPSHINLIALNEIEESQFKPSTKERQRVFAQKLSDKGLNVTIRRTLGSDIDASCGQLRRRMLKKEDDEF